MIDSNMVHNIRRKYGPEVSKAILNYYRNRGVKFTLATGFSSFQLTDFSKDTVKSLKTKDGKLREADAFVMFPNIYYANTEFIEQKDIFEDTKADTVGKCHVELDASLGNKVLFGAGSCVGHYFHPTGERVEHWRNHREAINTGRIASYNVLGLAIPYYMTPMSYTSHFTKNLQQIGNITTWDKV